MSDGRTELREGYAEVGDVRLHYVEAGDGPLIVLLHGFPEFWYGWRLQIEPLAAAGFRVVAPDLRGYNLSSKPDGVAAYDADKLAADVRGLIHERGAESALLVGHDWGGTAAWTLAMNHPEVVDRLAILNAAHPRKLNEGLRHPSQLATVLVLLLLRAPGPARAPRARQRLASSSRHFLRDAQPAVHAGGDRALHRGVVAAGAATAMINYYRFAVRPPSRRDPPHLGAHPGHLGRDAIATSAPTLAEPHHDDVPNLDRVERLPDASHWVHHDEAERVNQLLIDFFAPARATSTT